MLEINVKCNKCKKPIQDFFLHFIHKDNKALEIRYTCKCGNSGFLYISGDKVELKTDIPSNT